jgi:diguanylate cyclase (GGDEF)-like protein
MQPDRSRKSRRDIHPMTLRFRASGLETAYRRDAARRPRVHVRIGLSLLLAFHALLGLLDPYFVPDAHRWIAWVVRSAVLSYGIVVLAITFHPLFRRFDQLPSALTGVATAAGLSAVMLLMPPESASQYLVSVVIVVFWTYFLSGIRFVHGLWANVAIVAACYLAMGETPVALLASNLFFLISASLVAGTDAYLRERQRRLLFARESRAQAETPRHETRTFHDKQTSLPNRYLLADRLDQAILICRRDGRKCAGFYLDLDNLGQVNTEHGRAAGDEVLQIVAQRLQKAVRESDTVARLDEDEFFVVGRGIDAEDSAITVARRLLSCVDQPVSLLSGTDAQVSVSIGICLFPYPDCTADDIVYRCELGMRSAKAAGKRGYAFAGPGSSSEA